LTETGIEVIKARQLFPCRDELATKSTFKIAIRHHEKYTVLSNMPIRAKYRKDNMIRIHFENSVLMSAQDIIVVITTFTNRTINRDKRVTIWYRPSALEHIAYAEFIIKNVVLHFIEKYFPRLSKLDIVWHVREDTFATLGFLLQR